MSPELIALLSVIVSTLSTVLLRWAAYRWPSGYHDSRAVRNEKESE